MERQKPARRSEPLTITLEAGELAVIDKQRGPKTRDEWIDEAVRQRMASENLPPPYKEQTWVEAIKGRRTFLATTFRIAEAPHSQTPPITPDVIQLGGQVGANTYDLKIDRLWATEHKDKAKKEALEALEAFAAQVRKAIEAA